MSDETRLVCGATATLKFARHQYDGVVCILEPGHPTLPADVNPAHEGWLNGELVRFRAELPGPPGGALVREGSVADVDRLQERVVRSVSEELAEMEGDE